MSAHESITEADALREFPELSALLAIREAGWNFYHLRNPDGSLLAVAASRSQQRYTDALLIYDRTHVVANRLLDPEFGGGVVWFKDGGGLREVVTDLVALPAPGEPGAPSLVIRSSQFWTP